MLECFSALLLLYVVTCCENITLIWVNKIIPLLPCVVRMESGLSLWVRYWGRLMFVCCLYYRALKLESVNVSFASAKTRVKSLSVAKWAYILSSSASLSQAYKPCFHFPLSGTRSKFKFKRAWHYRSPTCLMACSICSTCSAESTAYLSFKLHLAISYLRSLWHNKLPTFLGEKTSQKSSLIIEFSTESNERSPEPGVGNN